MRLGTHTSNSKHSHSNKRRKIDASTTIIHPDAQVDKSRTTGTPGVVANASCMTCRRARPAHVALCARCGASTCAICMRTCTGPDTDADALDRPSPLSLSITTNSPNATTTALPPGKRRRSPDDSAGENEVGTKLLAEDGVMPEYADADEIFANPKDALLGGTAYPSACRRSVCKACCVEDPKSTTCLDCLDNGC
ncbi:hypothetical protein PLICRDRAFT_38856 [Plicaturopsis crispa FD-325 SS-3]|nr:hypothetical protein PLICRDRAFT_38856 [Plicaturopsis crispa FD-325 SS-3]